MTLHQKDHHPNIHQCLGCITIEKQQVYITLATLACWNMDSMSTIIRVVPASFSSNSFTSEWMGSIAECFKIHFAWQKPSTIFADVPIHKQAKHSRFSFKNLIFSAWAHLSNWRHMWPMCVQLHRPDDLLPDEALAFSPLLQCFYNSPL